MKFRIFQINMDRDKDRVAFQDLEHLEQFQGSPEINSAVYDMVYERDMGCSGLEELFRVFNLEHPGDYTGRSLSVSDIVEVVESPKVVGIVEIEGGQRKFTDFTEYTAFQEMLREQDREFIAHDYVGLDVPLLEPGFYFCRNIGFQKVKFQPELAGRQERKTIRVVLVEPGKLAREAQIDGSLEGMQRVVGGMIQAVYPFEEEVCIVCNEEGKLMGLSLNRALRTEETLTEMSYGDLAARFREAEGNGQHLSGYIVFTEDSFKEPFPKPARTYSVSSDNKAFQPGMGGYSIYGSAIDGSDPLVRLEAYMAAEKGGASGWKIERCYLVEAEPEIYDIVAGTFFICDCSGSNFGSLSSQQVDKYRKMFERPERFSRTEDGFKAVPYTPDKDHER